MFGYPKTVLVFKVAAEHDADGESIPESCYDSFMELAILDVKEVLYNHLKLYSPMPSAHGQIDLKIDDYQSAAADKEQLLDKWRDTYHVDFTDFIEFDA